MNCKKYISLYTFLESENLRIAQNVLMLKSHVSLMLYKQSGEKKDKTALSSGLLFLSSILEVRWGQDP